MKKAITGLLCLILVGCSTIGGNADPSNIDILTEAALIGVISWETSDGDSEEKGAKAIKDIDNYLLSIYGKNLLGQPKYTAIELIHNNILLNTVNPNTRRLMSIARLVIGKDGTLTGTTWGDAILFYTPEP